MTNIKKAISDTKVKIDSTNAAIFPLVPNDT